MKFLKGRSKDKIKTKKVKLKKVTFERISLPVLALIFCLIIGGTVFATTYTYTAPTEAMAVDETDVDGDGEADTIITASAHRAASPITDMLGCNTTSGFGMINGGAPDDLEDAESCAALGIWGTSLNDYPDPYYWNYFYNFYAAENGLDSSDDALINLNVAASPMAADTTTYEQYGGVSVSLYTRPDILVGVSSSGGSSDDTSGYDDQIALINSFTEDSEYYQDGDETYDPELVSYQTTRITDMIDTVYGLAEAMDNVTDETGAIGRYGDPDVIAENYEKYVYGISSYVLSAIDSGEVEKKVSAVVTSINEDGTFIVAVSEDDTETSSTRQVEYLALVTTDLGDYLGIEDDDDDGTITVTAEQLAQADVIVGASKNSEIDIDDENLTTYLENGGVDSEDIPMLITTTPDTLYGISMNSVENAMGLGYYVAYAYSDVMDIDPVEVCAFFYQAFYHISDLDSLATVVLTNFDETVLPDGITNILDSDYTYETVETWIATGMQYYEDNTSSFADTYIGTDWDIDWDEGIGSDIDLTDSDSSDDTTTDDTTTDDTTTEDTSTDDTSTSSTTDDTTSGSTTETSELTTTLTDTTVTSDGTLTTSSGDSLDVEISGDSSVISEDSEFTVAEVTDDSVIEEIEDALEELEVSFDNLFVLEIDLTDDGTEIHELDDYVEVTIDIPDGMSEDGTYEVYRLEDDGTLTALETSVVDGQIVFETDHFSTFAIVETDSDSSDSAASTSVSTGDSAVMEIVVFSAAIVAGAMVIVIRARKIKNSTI